MATYYVDYENGNDSNDGLSFANRKKTITSATTAASAGDEVRVAKSPDPTSIGNGTIPDPHQSIRQSRSISTITYSDVTGETDITVSSHNCQTGDIVEIYGNSNSYNINGIYEVTRVDSSSLKLNNYNAGAVASGSGGSCRVISGKCIKLASAPVKNIAAFAGGSQRTAWVASANVTTQLYSNYGDFSSTKATMQGGQSDQIVISSSFTTGKAAYYTLPSALDLSGYQQLSLHIHQYSGTKVLAGNYSLRLCSDTTGDTTVNTFTIPQPGQTSGTNGDLFLPITVDLGTNLGSSIQSIALYVDSDQGAQSIRMCNIIACKAKSSADSLTLNSLVGRNSSTVDDQKFWYTIESIEGDGDIIVVGPTGRTNYQKTSYYYAVHSSWLGDTGGTYTFYKRECFNTSVDNNTTSSSTAVQQINGSGSSTNKLTISGGWDTSDSMTTKNGESFYDGNHHDDGHGLECSSRPYITLENLGFFRYYRGFYITSCDYLSVKNCYAGLCAQNLLYYYYNDYNEDMEFYLTGGGKSRSVGIRYSDRSQVGSYIRKLYVSSVYQGLELDRLGQQGQFLMGTVWNVMMAQDMAIEYNYNLHIDSYSYPEGNTYSNGNPRIQYNYGPVYIGTYVTKNAYYGTYVYQNTQTTIGTYTASAESKYGYSASNYGIYMDQASEVKINGGSSEKYMYIRSGSKIYTNNFQIAASTEYNVSSAIAYARNHDGVSGSYYTKMQNGRLESDTTTRRTASGYSWKATITSTSGSYGNGFSWDVAKVAVQANSQVTANIYVNRTGTGIHGGLKIAGNQLAGFASTESYCMGSAGSWEQVTVSGTPTEDGIITIQAEAYYDGNTSHVAYFDDFSVTQA